MADRPRVFVQPDHPRGGAVARPRGVRHGPVGRRPAAATGRAAAPDRGRRWCADPPHRQGRRRVPGRRRTAASRGQQLRRRVRQHRCRRVRAARGPRRQHAGRPDRHDGGPRLDAADGRRAARGRGRPLRSRWPLEDVGTAPAPGPGCPWRDHRDRGLRADRSGRRASCRRLRDAHPVPRRQRAAGVRDGPPGRRVHAAR